MDKLIKYVRYSALAFVILLTGCFRNGLDECGDSDHYSYIKFEDIDINGVDRFPTDLKRMDIFLFDEDGFYMQRLTDRATGDQFPKKYTMGIPEQYKDAKRFVAFGGLNENNYSVSSMVIGQSGIADLEIALNPKTNNYTNDKLEPLFQGYVLHEAALNRNDTVRISLNKNHHVIRLIIQSLDDDWVVDEKEFDITVEAANSSYDAFNNIADYSTVWKYGPYVKKNDVYSGVVTETNTLRLMADDDRNRLKVNSLNDGGYEILDIDLNRFLNALRLEKYEEMDFQEFLDKQDVFAVAIFLDKDNGTQEGKWVMSRMEVNGWVVRDQDKGSKN